MSQTIFSVNYKNLKELISEIVKLEIAKLHNQAHLIQVIEQNRKLEPKLDYLSLYNKYPRKLGKTAGLRVCKNAIKTPEALLAAHSAIDRYVAHIKANKTEPQFIKQFSTFMNNWEDWLDESTGSVDGVIKSKTVREVVEAYESRRVRDHNEQT